MADQRSPDDLSPSLQAVLNSLNVNLENELNRYRRNRLTDSSSTDDVFADLADLEDPALDLDAVQSAAIAPLIAPTVTVSALAINPPPLPPNKKLLDAPVNAPVNTPDQAITRATAQAAADATATDILESMPVWQSGLSGAEGLYSDAIATVDTTVDTTAAATGPLTRILPTAMALGHYEEQANAGTVETTLDVATASSTSANGYLASSEKLIESLSQVPPMPEPISAVAAMSQRKTVSLLAGATLGLLALFAGLGASYLMSNPRVAQQLASGFMRSDEPVATTPAQKTFDPPGPDLSAQEFVDVETDNLSSLKMPSTTIDPLSATPKPPTSPTGLPPISNSQPGTQPGTQQPGLPSNIQTSDIQAASIPAGSNYYVIVPFTTEQGLADVRQSVQEAFVRQFADGNRVQLAAFDNPEMAQQFVAEVKAKGVSAQVYGPTAE